MLLAFFWYFKSKSSFIGIRVVNRNSRPCYRAKTKIIVTEQLFFFPDLGRKWSLLNFGQYFLQIRGKDQQERT